jgi:TPR repeat protein
VPRDAALVFPWFRRAAEQGDAQAQFTVGLMSANGNGTAKDDAQAVE